MRGHRTSLALLLASGWLAGCDSKLTLPTDALVSCGSTADCPADWVCHQSRCQVAATLDTTPPDLVSPAAVAPGVGRAGAAFTVDLEVTEALAAAPEVTLGLSPPVALSCATVGTLRYRCGYTATGAENGGAGGVVAFDVRLRDRALNVTDRKLAGSLRLDFAAPRLVTATVTYLPATGNPLAKVAEATAGTELEVTVEADELLSPSEAPTLYLVREPGGAGDPEIKLDLAGTSGTSGLRFRAVIPADQKDGTYLPRLSWGDVAGNTGPETFDKPTIRVKTSRPVLKVNQAEVLFVRSPWGNAAPEDLVGFVIPAGPYFAIAPADPLGNGRLPATTFAIDGLAPALIRIWPDSSQQLLLGATAPSADGTWPRVRLNAYDAPSAWVTGVDDAGNESEPIKLENAEWVATANPPFTGANPNTLARTGLAGTTRTPLDAVGPAPGSEVWGADANAALATASAAWRDRTATTTVPAGRTMAALAYDAGRGRVVLFGGASNGGGGAASFSNETWEWDGTQWLQLRPTRSPGGRAGHAMAYDAARGRVVLFGGAASLGFRDTWEWDGTAWVEITPATGPSARTGHALAYDPIRRRVVLFGGRLPSGPDQQTWLWDGKSWTLAAPAASPPARNEHVMAFDGVRGQLVLFGGQSSAGIVLQDTWTWNGVTWAPTAPATQPPALAAASMAYDAARQRVVLFGGSGASGTMVQAHWEWDGATWAQLTPAALPPGRVLASMAFDARRGRVVLFGGSSNVTQAVFQDLWEWDGTAWTRPAPAPTRAGRIASAAALDTARQRVVLFGGHDGSVVRQDTWEWDGAAWTALSPATSPPARDSAGAAYDATHGVTVLFGGTGAGNTRLQDTWLWNGTTWTQVSVAAPPPARSGHGMVYDATRGRVLLFGGLSSTSVALQDTWEWNGTTWVQLAPTTSPPARLFHGMAFDSVRGKTVLFGGLPSPTAAPLADTWEWNGTTWAQALPITSPPARALAGMAFDASRRRTALVGGTANLGNLSSVPDTWEWDGTTWRRQASGPDARLGAALVPDVDRGSLLLLGGYGGNGYLGDTWQLVGSTSARPAVQLDVDLNASGVAPSAVTGLRVRARAGATFQPAAGITAGAQLHGWSPLGAAGEPGAWLPLLANGAAAAASPPYLASSAVIDWSTASAVEASRYLVERDGLSFQVRPVGIGGADPGGARVALDYLEVRVRYTTP